MAGASKPGQGVERALGRLEAMVRRFETVDALREAMTKHTAAVVLVEPLAPANLLDTLSELADDERSAKAPRFVVVPDAFDDRKARTMYEAGAAVVFEWPYEAVLLPRVISGLLGKPPRPGGDRAGDKALTRAVKARLRLSETIGQGVDASVSDGAVVLTGRVDSLWKRERVQGMLMHVPGVVAVFTETLEVVPPDRSDASLAVDVRNVLRSVAGIDAKTISCSVADGRVALAGSVATHVELERVLNVLASIAGVRGVDNLLTVSAPATRRAHGLAVHLRKGVSTLWPQAEATITVFGKIAVLAGHVALLADKAAIERFARDTPGIERVVNKLQVVH